jgi:hypothetical protein
MPDNWRYWTLAAAIIALVVWGTWMKWRNTDPNDIFDLWS